MKITFSAARQGKSESRHYTLDMPDPVAVIGRSGCDLCLKDPLVSRFHAAFVQLADVEGLWLRDLGSRNGTLVNGNKITEARLTEGDEIRLGTFAIVILKITEEDASERPEPTVIGQLPKAEDEQATTGLHDVKHQVLHGWPDAFLSLPRQARKKFEDYSPVPANRGRR